MRVTIPESRVIVIFDALILDAFCGLFQVRGVASISVVGLIGNPVPDDAGRQVGVVILGRLAAQVAQQSEFPKISDIPGVSILHAIVTNIL
ncbi:MAG TPA: hypothetical protein VFC29_20990 [Candidatus Limnocylindrales bacterium]|nr:hypothetical protein [Candidatus Limnocylindrales bacterium]